MSDEKNSILTMQCPHCHKPVTTIYAQGLTFMCKDCVSKACAELKPYENFGSNLKTWAMPRSWDD